ncbi:MAG TPA: hypothetical protein VF817_05105 [Patescibacteria group bacterium]
MEKMKSLIQNSVDIVFGLAYISIPMGLLGWVLDTSKEWSTISFGEYFSDNKWWFSFWVLSLFYIPLRFLMRGEFWKMIFDNIETGGKN